MHCETIQDLDALADVREAWDRLAVACGRPFCAPGWLLPWWRHAAPAGATLCVLVAKRDDEVVGIGPWFIERSRTGLVRYRPLGAAVCQRVVPLCVEGLERDVAAVFAQALARNRPPPAVLSFESVDSDSPWPQLLRDAWPGRKPWIGLLGTQGAPTVDLKDRDFDDWFMSKTKHFRQRMRKSRKEFESRGGRFHLAGESELERGLEDFARLHYARWESRGGSAAVTPGVEAMLRETGRELLPSGRFRLWSLELSGETISSHVLLVAGNEVGYWQIGTDGSRGADFSASRLGILNSIEDAFGQRARRMDLGAGTPPFKIRFADGEDRLDWLWFVPRGWRYPLTRIQLLPAQLRRAVSERLSPKITQALRQRLRRRRSNPRPT